MKYEAVIFDLGGTLIRNAKYEEYVNAAKRVAGLIAAPEEEFLRQWFADSSRLSTGEFATYDDYIRHTCSRLDMDSPEHVMEDAVDSLIEVSRKMMADIHPGAVDLLKWLKTMGYKTGLISDCSTDIPALWHTTPFPTLIDETIFSCDTGINKADIRIFHLATEKLGVDSARCVYVADGMRSELTNAASTGMHSVQIYIPEEIDDTPMREKWHGPVINSLGELKAILS